MLIVIIDAELLQRLIEIHVLVFHFVQAVLSLEVEVLLGISGQPMINYRQDRIVVAEAPR